MITKVSTALIGDKDTAGFIDYVPILSDINKGYRSGKDYDKSEVDDAISTGTNIRRAFTVLDMLNTLRYGRNIIPKKYGLAAIGLGLATPLAAPLAGYGIGYGIGSATRENSGDRKNKWRSDISII